MKLMMSSWWKEFSFYHFWEAKSERLDWDEEDHSKPLIHFSFETWFTETRPLCYYATNDTGRWRGIHFRVYVSRYLIGLTVPFKPLPDYIPTGKAMLRTRRIHAECEAQRAAKKV